MTTIAQQIIEIVVIQKPIGGQTEGGVVFKLKDGWLLKVGKDIDEKIIKDNKVLEGLSLKLNSTITQAVNGEIYSLNTSDPRDNISIIHYVPNQEYPDFKKGQKKIEDFPLSAYVLLIGQMMDAIANGLYPDLIGANILVNYKEQSFQLIDSFTNQETACRTYSISDANYFTALYDRLKKLNDGNDDQDKILDKLSKAIKCIGFTQSNGPYENDNEEKNILDKISKAIKKIFQNIGLAEVDLEFPPFNTKGLGLMKQIPLSADIDDTLIRQLNIIEARFPPNPICYLPDRTAQRNR